ncbi:PH domain-containing protein [Actinomadura logoneensis]|nr:PH domain-containing protein [Actinomadura logoneensis]
MSENADDVVLEYETAGRVPLLIFSGVLAAVGVVAACVVVFGIGWSDYADWATGPWPSRYTDVPGERHTAYAWLLAFGLFLGALGIAGLVAFRFPAPRTRVDAAGLHMYRLGRERTFAWSEISDITLKESSARGRKVQRLAAGLGSGRSVLLPGLATDDLPATGNPEEELRRIRDDLRRHVQRT